MVGYIVAVIVLVYFVILWPRFEELPPRSARLRRQRLAGKLGLHNIPSVGELNLTSSNREELLNLITFMDTDTFSRIYNSQHFYLVESRNSVLTLYCSVKEPTGNVDYRALQTDTFMRVLIEEHLLIRFLNELGKGSA